MYSIYLSKCFPPKSLCQLQKLILLNPPGLIKNSASIQFTCKHGQPCSVLVSLQQYIHSLQHSAVSAPEHPPTYHHIPVALVVLTFRASSPPHSTLPRLCPAQCSTFGEPLLWHCYGSAAQITSSSSTFNSIGLKRERSHR